MADPTNAKPSAGAEGSIENPSRGASTGGVYIDTVPDEVWEAAVIPIIALAGGDSERGERARRAVHALCGQPFVARPVWTAAESLAWIFVAAILSGDDDLRARANTQVKQVLALAAESRESLGRAA